MLLYKLSDTFVYMVSFCFMNMWYFGINKDISINKKKTKKKKQNLHWGMIDIPKAIHT